MKCKSLEEVRENIDRLDKEIVKLIAERSTYVIEAANFKINSNEVEAPKRVEEVIKKVRKLAEDNNIDSYIIENVYRIMIESFINFELSQYKRLGQKDED